MKLSKSLLVFGLSLSLLATSQAAQADNYASNVRSQAAKGHYARARTLLVEALAEFERGRRLAKPDMLLDPTEWRVNVTSRAEELNRVLDPQPRVTRAGVRYKANPLLIQKVGRPKPKMDVFVEDTNTFGEEQRELEKARAIAARINAESKPEPNIIEQKIIEAKASESMKQLENTNTIENTASNEPQAEIINEPTEAPSLAEQIEEPSIAEQIAGDTEDTTSNLANIDNAPANDSLANPDSNLQIPTDADQYAAPNTDLNKENFSPDQMESEVLDVEEDEVSKAIEAAIKARLERIQQNQGTAQ